MAPRVDYSKVCRKYDIPIYCGDWAVKVKSPVEGESDEAAPEKAKTMNVIFGGGGGERKHGIKNRIVMASFNFETEELSEEIYHFSTEDDPPFKLGVHPSGECVIAAFEKGCRLYDMKLDEDEKLLPSERKLPGLEEAGEQKFVIFSPDGSRLAAGGEDKRLRVFEWPSMKVLLDVENAHNQPLKDADFSVDGAYLATTADSGPCHVWDITKDTAVATLAIKDGKLGLCRFSRDATPVLFTTAVRSGKGLVVVWSTSDWKQLGAKRFQEEPISAFALSKDGQLLATGTAGGDVAIIDAKKMMVRQRVAGAHMVFITAVEFSPDSKALLSVSGDSSARVTVVTPPQSGFKVYLILLLLFIITALLAMASYHNPELFWQFLGHNQPDAPGQKAVYGGSNSGSSGERSAL